MEGGGEHAPRCLAAVGRVFEHVVDGEQPARDEDAAGELEIEVATAGVVTAVDEDEPCRRAHEVDEATPIAHPEGDVTLEVSERQGVAQRPERVGGAEVAVEETRIGPRERWAHLDGAAVVVDGEEPEAPFAGDRAELHGRATAVGAELDEPTARSRSDPRRIDERTELVGGEEAREQVGESSRPVSPRLIGVQLRWFVVALVTLAAGGALGGVGWIAGAVAAAVVVAAGRRCRGASCASSHSGLRRVRW